MLHEGVAGVFAEVGDITINPHHLAAKQARVIGMCNHPPSAYPASMKLLEKAQGLFPLRDFVTHVFGVTQSRRAMEQVMDVDTCMKVVIAPEGGEIRARS